MTPPPSMMWVGLMQSAEILKREDWGRLKRKEFCLQMAFRLKLNITASLGLQPAGLPIELWLASSHTCESQFLKIKSLYTHIFCWFCFFGKSWVVNTPNYFPWPTFDKTVRTMKSQTSTSIPSFFSPHPSLSPFQPLQKFLDLKYELEMTNFYPEQNPCFLWEDSTRIKESQGGSTVQDLEYVSWLQPAWIWILAPVYEYETCGEWSNSFVF